MIDMPSNMGGGCVQDVCSFATDPALVNQTKFVLSFRYFQDFEEVLPQIRPGMLLNALCAVSALL